MPALAVFLSVMCDLSLFMFYVLCCPYCILRVCLDYMRVRARAHRYANAQLDPEVLIVALIYLERILRRTNGRLKVRPYARRLMHGKE